MATEAPEIKIVDSHRIACDGGEGALGHPRVWLHIPQEEGFVELVFRYHLPRLVLVLLSLLVLWLVAAFQVQLPAPVILLWAP